MKMQIIAIGNKMPLWIKAGWETYSQRFPREYHLSLIEIPVHQSNRLSQKIPSNGHLVLLDQCGENWTTQALSQQFGHWQLSGKNIIFLIGGAEGHRIEIIKKAHQRWSLSPLTFPHMLVRVLVAEQLYRALTILSGHPYHRE